MDGNGIGANLAALIAWLVTWVGYETFFVGRLRPRRSLNDRMIRVRRAWAEQLLARDVRLLDSQLVGHSIKTATFFASTTVLILAGLIGVLGSADRIHAAVANLSAIAPTDVALFEAKIGLLVLVFVYAFLQFTWALRQLNYFCGMIGSAPPPAQCGDPALADAMGDVLGHAIANLNGGFRAYYFALAALGWILHPAALALGGLAMAAVLARRQLASPAARAMHDWVERRGG